MFYDIFLLVLRKFVCLFFTFNPVNQNSIVTIVTSIAASCVFILCMYIYVLCMNMCVYVCMYVCMYVRTYVCTYVCMYVCMYVRTYVCMYVCMYVCTYVRMYVFFFKYGLLLAPLLLYNRNTTSI